MSLLPPILARPVRVRLAGVLALVIGAAAPATALAADPAPGTLTIVGRSITQDQGAWRIDYRLRYDGATGAVVTPTEITAKVEAWVSNSRAASHAVPRWSSV